MAKLFNRHMWSSNIMKWAALLMMVSLFHGRCFKNLSSSLFNWATFSFPQTTTSLKTHQTILLVVSSPCSPICPTKTDHRKPAFCFTSKFYHHSRLLQPSLFLGSPGWALFSRQSPESAPYHVGTKPPRKKVKTESNKTHTPHWKTNIFEHKVMDVIWMWMVQMIFLFS